MYFLLYFTGNESLHCNNYGVHIVERYPYSAHSQEDRDCCIDCIMGRILVQVM